MQVETGLTTFFPRPEEIVSATREMERGKREPKDVDALYVKWTNDLLQVEEKKGLSWKTGGQLSWHDLFRPLIESSKGLVAGSLTRWFETNSFFRRPVVEALPTPVPGALAKRFHPKGDRLAVVLPGPYTFAHLSENKTKLADTQVFPALSKFLAAEASELSAAGVHTFIFHEPLLARQETKGADIGTLYGPVLKALEGQKVIVWTYFGDGTRAIQATENLPIYALGVDLSETPIKSLLTSGYPKGKTLGLGCIDSRTSLPEDPRDIAAIMKDVKAQLGVGKVILGPGAPMDLLPWETALLKLEALPEASRRFASS